MSVCTCWLSAGYFSLISWLMNAIPRHFAGKNYRKIKWQYVKYVTSVVNEAKIFKTTTMVRGVTSLS